MMPHQLMVLDCELLKGLFLLPLDDNDIIINNDLGGGAISPNMPPLSVVVSKPFVSGSLG